MSRISAPSGQPTRRISPPSSQQRFVSMLLLAIALHGAFLLCLDFHPPQIVLKKMIAPLFEVAEPSSSSITVNLQSLMMDDKKAVSAPDSTLPLELAASKEKHSSTNKVSLKSNVLPVSTPTPIRRRTISAAAHQTQDATYLARWQTYIEKFGNEHYPQNNVKGDLRLLVAINRDGSLHEVRLRQSSGSPLLDQAAINIVLAAAPFEPLPAEIAAETEVLEIIRTWQFRGKLHTSH